MSIWTVKAENVTRDLLFTDPDTGEVHKFWIKLKRALTVGEQRRIVTAGWRGMTSGSGQGTEISIDWRQQTFARTEAYLVDWSLEDDNHNKLPVTRDVIESLSEDVYGLIETAINEHVAAMAQEKKARAGSK